LPDNCFWETPPNDDGQLQAAERIHKDALCPRKFKLIKLNEANQAMRTNNTMIATINTSHSLITDFPGLPKFNKGKTAY
jgi:hypothetical protein